jgi:hypothetical protein
MAAYDSPGFVYPTAAGPLDGRAYSSPGSASAADDDGGTVGIATVTQDGASSHVPVNLPEVSVAAGDTGVVGAGLDGNQAYADTGAGNGTPLDFHRYDWQAKPGGAR